MKSEAPQQPFRGKGFVPSLESSKRMRRLETAWFTCGCVLPAIGGGAVIAGLWWIIQHQELARTAVEGVLR